MEAARKNNHSDAVAGFAPVAERVAAGAREVVDRAAGFILNLLLSRRRV